MAHFDRQLPERRYRVGVYSRAFFSADHVTTLTDSIDWQFDAIKNQIEVWNVVKKNDVTPQLASATLAKQIKIVCADIKARRNANKYP